MDYFVITLHMGYQFVYRKAIYEYSDVGIHRKERKENFLYNLMLKFLEAQSPSSGGEGPNYSYSAADLVIFLYQYSNLRATLIST